MSNEVTLSKKLFLICICFISGVFFAPFSFLLGLFLSTLFYLPLRNTLATIACMLAFVAGFFSFHYRYYQIPDHINTPLLVRVVEEPLLQRNFTRLTVEHEKGRALLYVDRYADYHYGDVLLVDGKFRFPENDDYANYLIKEGVYHTSFRPYITKIGNHSSFFHKTIYRLRARARDNIRKNLSPPQSFIAEAVVLGDRSSFSEDFNNKLSISGTRHITAISGIHIVIISSLLISLFSFLKLEKKWASLFALVAIALFIIFVGAPPSAVRAGTMGGIGVVGSMFYRKKHSLRLVILVATLMLLFNPLLLHYDLGFQLSFLAVVGIISLHEPIKKRVPLRGDGLAKDLLAITIAAQVMVTPIIVYNFGHLSLASVPANIIIVPLLPYVIPLIFAVAVTGNAILSLFAQGLVATITTVIDITSLLPFATISIYSTPFYIIIITYGYIFYRIRAFVRW